MRVGESGSPLLLDGQQNLTSLLAWQSIVPVTHRASISAIGHHEIGSTLLTSEMLVTDRDVTFQYGPEVIFDLPLGAAHPQNPFPVPVAVSAALTGLPTPQQEVNSTLVRGVVEASGPILSKANYRTYFLHTSDSAMVTFRNEIDLLRVIEGLSGHAAIPFNIITDAPGAGGTQFLAPTRRQRFVNGATQFAAHGNGSIWQLPTGPLSADVGIEARREFAEFLKLGSFDRDVVSVFGIIQAPFTRGVKAEFGIRRDDYEALSPVTSYRYKVSAQPYKSLRVHASYSDAFKSPDFFDLRFPKTVVHGIPIFDPKRLEIGSITILTGGNEDLRPTTGHASSIGIQLSTEDSSFASLSLWRVKMRGRISLVPPLTLLAYEDTAISGRIKRDSPSVDDLNNRRPGRLTELDITRANFGTTKLQGFDVTLVTTLRTSFGNFRPRLDVSYSDEFRVSELPTIDSPERERSGIASEFGTITTWRLRGSLNYTYRNWSANVLARYNSCYEDFLPAQGRRSGRNICPGVGLDVQVAKELSKHIRLMLGASDVYTGSIPYADVNDVGFDLSQSDIAGPTAYVGVAIKL